MHLEIESASVKLLKNNMLEILTLDKTRVLPGLSVFPNHEFDLSFVLQPAEFPTTNQEFETVKSAFRGEFMAYS